MNFKNIIKIVSLLLGLAGIIFLITIISKGDEAIEAAALMGDTSAVSPMVTLAFITLGLILLIVLVFVIKNLFSNTATLKKTLINVGAFLGLFLISYLVFADGVETPLKDGEVLSAGGSKLVGAGLWLFYFLILIAAGLMLLSGTKRMIKK